MTVQKDVTKNIYVGNGSTRTFPFTFECPAEHPEYIKVYLMQDDGTALATSDYQLDMDAKQITYPSSGTALPEGKKLVIMRELPLQQMMNLVNNGPYFAEDIETAFDECVMAMQQIAEKLNRSIIMSVDIDGDAFVNEVPFEAGKSFRIADDGKSIVLTEDPAKVLPLAQGVYTQTQAQAQSAAASAAAAAKSEDSAFESAGVAGNSAQYASLSAASAAENAELTSGYKQEALTAKNDAATSATNAKASEANAKTSENNAEASKEAAQSAASNANNFATSASSSAGEAKSYRDASSNYAANAKNYSENVNVFLPSVSDSGVLSWTNKAGLANPASVNIKGAKGDKGDTGTAATIKVGTVTTGAAGSAASVVNRGDVNNAIFDFVLPKGTDGKGSVITVNGKEPDAGGNVNIATMVGASDSAAGKAGLAPAPAAGMQNKFLCADATWKDAGGLPVGHEFFTTNPNIPAGCIPLLGGEYSRTAYADLWAWVQTQNGYLLEESAWQAKAAANSGNVPFYSKGDGTTTFRVPALKCWVRGAGSISEVGGYLAAGLPNIDTNVYVGQDGKGNPNGSADSITEGDARSYCRQTKLFRASDYNPIYGSSITVQPPSIVGLWCVKAYGTVTNVGSADVANIASGLTSLETRFSTDVTPIRLGGTGATTAHDARSNLGVDIDVLLADATLLWQNPSPTSSFSGDSLTLSQPYTNFKRLLFITSVASNGYTFVSASFINVDALSSNIELARNNGWTYVTYIVGMGGSGIYGDVSMITTTSLQYSTRSGLRPQFVYGYK